MELRFSVLARNREFSKAMRRIRPRFTPLLEEFARAELENPMHQAILVGITADKGPEFFQEVLNSDGFFQVLAGVQIPASDSSLLNDVFAILRRAAQTCPFSNPDHQTIQTVFNNTQSRVLIPE